MSKKNEWISPFFIDKTEQNVGDTWKQTMVGLSLLSWTNFLFWPQKKQELKDV
jgi:hypothetical protein